MPIRKNGFDPKPISTKLSRYEVRSFRAYKLRELLYPPLTQAAANGTVYRLSLGDVLSLFHYKRMTVEYFNDISEYLFYQGIVIAEGEEEFYYLFNLLHYKKYALELSQDKIDRLVALPPTADTPKLEEMEAMIDESLVEAENEDDLISKS